MSDNAVQIPHAASTFGTRLAAVPLTIMALVVSLVSALACGAAAAADLPGATPRSPAEERATFQFADAELTADLVAAEPDVISPVAMCWDSDGALYVAEMRDYPVGPGGGTIRRLVDADGDGRYETVTVFADKLNFPNGLLCARDGLLVTATPDLLFLRDTDSNGVADERRVLFTGFAEGNQQLRANGLVWGLDNWVYGANGRSDGSIRRPTETPEQAISIRTRDFRFRADGSAFEPVIGQSQFGQSRDDWGHRFLSWNTIPIRQMMFDEGDLARNPRLAAAAVHNIAPVADPGDVFPIAPRPQTFNRESTNHYNALCGLTIYRGHALGDAYYGNAFVGESLSSLVHRRELVPQGPTFVSRRVEQDKDFLAAADPWFHPVFLTTGPDGALYLADFYRRWVEHPQFVAGEWRDKVDWREGVAHGRIWRIRRRDFSHRSAPRLARASTAGLVSHLTDSSAWVRDTAQRLLYERHDAAAVPPLSVHLKAQDSRAAVIALQLLSDQGALDDAALTSALADSRAEVRRHAVQLATGRWETSTPVRSAALALASDNDFSVRFELVRALGRLPGSEKLPALLSLAQSPDADGWMARALSASAADIALPWLRQLAAGNSTWLSRPSAEQLEALDQIAEQVAATGLDRALLDCIDFARGEPGNIGQLAVLAGAARGRRATVPLETAHLAEKLQPAIRRAVDLASQSNASAEYRVLAIRVLGELATPEQVDRLLPLCDAAVTGVVVDAAVTALCRRGSQSAIQQLIDGWSSYSPSRRRQLSAAVLESQLASQLFVAALQRDLVKPAEIDPALRTALTKVRDPNVAAQAEQIFAAAAPAPRDEVLAKYRPALDLTGKRERGAALFKAHCNTCHLMFGLGRQVGPDLSAVGGRPKETLLADILDPSRQVAPDFLAYTLMTRDGRTLAGLLVSDTASAVTMRRGEGADDTIARSEIEELQASLKSLMPEGFEERLSVEDVADLLSFLGLPERRLLESAPAP